MSLTVFDTNQPIIFVIKLFDIDSLLANLNNVVKEQNYKIPLLAIL